MGVFGYFSLVVCCLIVILLVLFEFVESLIKFLEIVENLYVCYELR